MKKHFKKPIGYRPVRSRKPKPKKTSIKCDGCQKRLTDFELIYGCFNCNQKQNQQ